MMVGRRALVALMVLAALAPRAVGARVTRGVRLRLEGYFGPPPEGRTEAADLVLRVGQTDRRFQVTKATVLSANALAADVLDRVKPYKPSFVLRGPEALLAKLREANDGTKLVMSGLWDGRTGSRNLLLAGVEVE
jgi:hypothetical protein